MTLAVGLNVPDGIVIAADSLSTRRRVLTITSVEMVCPECKNKVKVEDVKTSDPTMALPVSTQSYSQKVFTFGNKMGIACHGAGFLENKTIYYHIKKLENEKGILKKGREVDKEIDILVKYFSERISRVPGFERVPFGSNLFGFLVGFYEGSTPKVIDMDFGKYKGKECKITEHTNISCTIAGDTALVNCIWEHSKESKISLELELFSLQDAVDYAEFLIKFTSDYQRFLAMIPTVGGKVDIILITPYKPPLWIKSKRLNKLLQKGENND